MVSNYIKSFIKYLDLLPVMISVCCESPCCHPEQKSRKKISLPKIRYNQDKYERREGEDAPLGMILCAGKKQEQIELLELSRSGIHVAEYLTDSLPKEALQEKLRKAIAHARKQIESHGKEWIAENVVKLLEAE